MCRLYGSTLWARASLLKKVLLFASLFAVSSASTAAVIAAKILRLDQVNKALIELSDEPYQCDGDANGRFAVIIVAMVGATRPTVVYRGCYTTDRERVLLRFWDPSRQTPSQAAFLPIDKASLSKTPQFHSWE